MIETILLLILALTILVGMYFYIGTLIKLHILRQAIESAERSASELAQALVDSDKRSNSDQETYF